MSTELRQPTRIGGVLRPIAAAMLACGLIGSACAFELKSDDPDVTASIGTTLRYNLGVRTHGRDPVIANTINNSEGDYSYNRGQVVTNRIDLLSELDFDYKRQLGFRVSATAWADAAYHSNVNIAPQFANANTYNNSTFSPYMERYFKGPSGEFLDAYVYTNFNLGSAPASVKVGRDAVLWGEVLSLSNHSVSYNQSPTDGRKAIANPGITAKEAARPIGQVYGSVQLSPQVTVAAQYFYEWQQNTAPEGGSYLSVLDAIMLGPDRFCLAAAGPCLPNKGLIKPKQSGDWGFMVRWKADWLDGGTLGFYAREFTERNGWLNVSPPLGKTSWSFAEGTRLYGISLAKAVGGLSVGAELLTRRDTALQATNIDPVTNLGPRGNTTHALVNGQVQFGVTPAWSSAVVTAELAYAHLDSITLNPARFKRCTAGQDVSFGCSTTENWVTALSFSPTWVAVAPGWDLSAAARLVYGIKGNTPVLSNSSGRERTGSYSLSVTLDYNAKQTFTLAYNGYLATYRANAAGTAIAASNGDQLQDRGWLSFTYQIAF